MKRLFKFLVAAATSFSLLFANVPLAEFAVRADTNAYTFKNAVVDQSEILQFSDGETAYTAGSDETVFEAGTITLELNDTVPGHFDELRVTTREDNVDTTLCSTDGESNSVDITSGFKVVSISDRNIDEKTVGVLEIVYVNNDPPVENGDPSGDPNPGQQPAEEVYTIEIRSNLTRSLYFEANGHTETSGVNGKPGEEPVSVTKEFRESDLPDNLVIDNPGGVGVENLGRLTKVVINGTEKDVTARYDRCEYELPGKDSYSDKKIVIEIMGDDKPGGVIEWTNSGCPAEQRQHNISEEEQFKNGSARVVGVYEATDTSFQNNIMADYGIDDKGCLYDAYNGCLRLENGYWIAFEFIPEPGYQLVEFGGNAGAQGGSLDIGTTDIPNVYYFQMPQGNCHFSAVFDDPANLVKINGDSIVNNGAIEVPANEFAGGTAQMSVGSLDGNTRSAYDNNAGVQAELKENDLEIEEYLSLDLANIYQKANTNDYWEEDYHNLEKGNASVTLKVDDDFNPDNNKVYIVHDLGDGEGVETIEADYNPNTHEITFETGSFSNFMIATSDEKNDVDVDPNKNNNPVNDDPENNDEPEDYTPHFSVALDEYDEPALGNWEGEDHPFLAPVEIGQAIPGDSVIHNDLPNDLPDDIKLIYYINGEEVESFYMNERDKTFSPGHFVVLDGVYASEGAFMVFFTECYVVGIDVIQMDLSLKALDKDGKVIEPVGGSDDSGALIFECGKADDEDFTYYEIAYPVCPYEIAVKGLNGYAIYYLECNEKDVLNTPIGENKFKYSAEDDYTWVSAWGRYHEAGDVVEFVDEEFTAVFEGLSAEEASKYIIVVDYSDIDSMDDPRLATYKAMVEAEGYTDVLVGGGFDITLYDKNGVVHDPGCEVTITIALENNDPDFELEDGQEIMFLHLLSDGGYELVKATYDAAKNTVTFKTSTFSPFIAAIGKKVTTAPASVVKTGEDVNTTRIVIASLLIGAAAAAGILFIRRRETEKEQN